MAAAGPHGAFKARYQPLSGSLVGHWEAVGWLCIRRKNLVVGVDEIDSLCNAHTWKVDKEYWRTHPGAVPALQHIVEWGRHEPMGMICAARDPASVKRAITRNSHEVDLFRDQEPNDLDYFKKRMGENVAELVKTLPKFHYLAYIEGDPLTIRKSQNA
jgi:hypothetical protein